MGLFTTFQSDVGGREHVCGSRCISVWNCDCDVDFSIFCISCIFWSCCRKWWCWCGGDGSEGLSVGDVSADFTEDASLSGGIDYGLGGEGARWWAHYRLPRV